MITVSFGVQFSQGLCCVSKGAPATRGQSCIHSSNNSSSSLKHTPNTDFISSLRFVDQIYSSAASEQQGVFTFSPSEHGGF